MAQFEIECVESKNDTARDQYGKFILQPLDQGQDQEQATPEQYPPVDNTADKGSNESETPELDRQVEKFSKVINMK